MIYIASILYLLYGLYRRIQDSFEYDLSVKLWNEPIEDYYEHITVTKINFDDLIARKIVYE